MTKPIKILIACNSILSLIGIRELLSDEDDFLIVKETSTVDDTICWVEKKKTDIILVCAHLLAANGSDFVAKIKENCNAARIIVFNSSFNKDQQSLLIQKGVVGIIKSDCSKQTLLKALRKIYAGEYWFGRDLISAFINSNLHTDESTISANNKTQLTRRELEVLSHIAAGSKNNEIASKLYISETTVKTHINSIYKKLEVDDRLQATFYAIKYNILPK